MINTSTGGGMGTLATARTAAADPDVLGSAPVDFYGVVTLLVAAAFVGLLIAGRRDIARGANAAVASGAMLLVIATIVGVLLLQMLSYYV